MAWGRSLPAAGSWEKLLPGRGDCPRPGGAWLLRPCVPLKMGVFGRAEPVGRVVCGGPSWACLMLAGAGGDEQGIPRKLEAGEGGRQLLPGTGDSPRPGSAWLPCNLHGLTNSSSLTHLSLAPPSQLRPFNELLLANRPAVSRRRGEGVRQLLLGTEDSSGPGSAWLPCPVIPVKAGDCGQRWRFGGAESCWACFVLTHAGCDWRGYTSRKLEAGGRWAAAAARKRGLSRARQCVATLQNLGSG